MGMDDCRRFCEIRGEKDPFLRPLPIYATQQTMNTIKMVFQYAFEQRPVPITYFYPQPHIIEGKFIIGDLEISPITLPHGHTTSTGFLFFQQHTKMLAYLSDSQALPEKVIQEVVGVKTLIMDGLRRTPHPTHMCLDEALYAARRIKANRTILTHLNHEYDHDVDQAELPLGVELAYDGLQGTTQ
jgi:phosphoribosyl 1,2-cyclic phosphate phosphodiesterase